LLPPIAKQLHVQPALIERGLRSSAEDFELAIESIQQLCHMRTSRLK
jgi:hypothetical protein